MAAGCRNEARLELLPKRCTCMPPSLDSPDFFEVAHPGLWLPSLGARRTATLQLCSGLSGEPSNPIETLVFKRSY